MALALFDLDNTLLAGDSDYLWGCYLAEHGIVDGEAYESENQRFYDQYLDGSLDIHEFLRFQLKPLADHSRQQLEAWREEFLATRIEPIMLEKAHQLLDRHRAAGDELLIITATNRFITEPIAARYGIRHLLATEPELRNGEYTGGIIGEPCFQGGKVKRLQQWLKENRATLDGSWFYSDSHNDLPLLEQVDYPVAVDPDDKLRALANERGWPVTSLR
ncbi:HAD superfamily hydrolase (TIGR01490 family) [Thiogranum longum]|uniref:Histidinol-phosphatase n=1 Tax=Thiogranum longum TaxID=1537524 RepID=A0A4R1HIK3_9GAMM|nr:HAD family phosphatase [Thiogranum longum]TCK19269.1 HAD superfamily hydrolase (TIGR01490 family) [Thiogranum longum]